VQQCSTYRQSVSEDTLDASGLQGQPARRIRLGRPEAGSLRKMAINQEDGADLSALRQIAIDCTLGPENQFQPS